MDEDARIAECRNAFAGALARGDASTACAVYAEGARLVAPAAELIEGRAAVEAFWRAGIEAGISAAEREPLHFRQEGGFAFEIGRYSLRLEPADGSVIVDRGKYLLVHERQRDGCWRWAIEMFHPDEAPIARVGTKDIPQAPEPRRPRAPRPPTASADEVI